MIVCGVLSLTCNGGISILVPPALMHEDVRLCSHGNLPIESQPLQQQWANWSHSEVRSEE